MNETLVVSSRGQVTLPAVLRKRLGIKTGDVLILEDCGSEVVLKPGVVIETHYYSDQEIAQWDDADRLPHRERARILGKLSGKK